MFGDLSLGGLLGTIISGAGFNKQLSIFNSAHLNCVGNEFLRCHPSIITLS